MSKSNYEIYAEKRQIELLDEVRSFRLCLEWLKNNKKEFSKEYVDAQIDLAAALYGLTSGEIERAIEDKAYCCKKTEKSVYEKG